MRTIKIATALLCAATLAACAEKAAQPTPDTSAQMAAAPAPQPSPTPGGPGMAGARVIHTTAKVKAVDLSTRMVTIKRQDGTTATIHADDSVKNLDQLKPGDRIVMDFYQSVAVALKKKGTATRGVTAAEQMDTAEKGQMPGAVGARVVTVTAKITKIDKKNQTVTLKGPDGKSTTVDVKNPENLQKAHVGDYIEITYTEALAIAVEKPAPATKSKKKS